MRTIRKNVFETNSSSTHSVVLRPAHLIDPIDRHRKNGKPQLFTYYDSFSYCPKKKMLVLERMPDFHFGVIESFYDKLNYVVYLLLYRHSSELIDKWEWDDIHFTVTKANMVLNEHYSDFVKRIAEHASKKFGVDVQTIGFLSEPGRGGRKCSFGLDHEVLSDSQEEDLGIHHDLYDLITTDGLAILYEFS